MAKPKLSAKEQVLYDRMVKNPATGLIEGGTFGVWLKRLWKNRGKLSGRQTGRILMIFLGALAMSPFRFFDRVIHGSKIAKTKVSNPPVFIIGCYRSGTTFLHNLMSLNQDLTAPTNQQIAFPETFITGSIIQTPIGKLLTPKYRPLDATKIKPSSPQEHQYAMLNMMYPVFTDCMVFPSNAEEWLEKYSRVHKLPESLNKKWKQKFTHFVKKLTYASKGKQLIMKTPYDTMNIPTLLELYPDARFIHVTRSPWEIYPSLVNMYRSLMYHLQLENNDFHQLTDIARNATLKSYKDLKDGFEHDKHLVPEENITYIQFPELITKPVETIMAIHKKLRISHPENLQGDLKAYINSQDQKEYKPNRFDNLSSEDFEFIEKAWDLTPPKLDSSHEKS